MHCTCCGRPECTCRWFTVHDEVKQDTVHLQWNQIRWWSRGGLGVRQLPALWCLPCDRASTNDGVGRRLGTSTACRLQLSRIAGQSRLKACELLCLRAAGCLAALLWPARCGTCRRVEMLLTRGAPAGPGRGRAEVPGERQAAQPRHAGALWQHQPVVHVLHPGQHREHHRRQARREGARPAAGRCSQPPGRPRAPLDLHHASSGGRQEVLSMRNKVVHSTAPISCWLGAGNARARG